MPGPGTPARPSIREQIAAKRAEIKANTPVKKRSAAQAGWDSPGRFGTPKADVLDDKTVKGQVKRAAKSGRLDIASLELHRIPPDVFSVLLGINPKTLDRPPTPPPADKPVRRIDPFAVDAIDAENPKDVFGKELVKEHSWVECEEVTMFKASGNNIDRLDLEIGGFGGLKAIDLSRNILTRLPDSFADLLKLTNIDLSTNKLTAFPPQILLLPQLVVLDLSHNEISTIDFSSPTQPSDDGLAYGAGFLSTTFWRNREPIKDILPALKTLQLGYNAITNGALADLKALGNLRVLGLEQNKLEDVLDLDALGLDLSDLQNLNLGSNPRLRQVKGLPDSVEVNMKGSNTAPKPTPKAEDTEAGSSTGAAPVEATPARPAKPALPVPEPTLTIVFKSYPAATFDSEPLGVNFDIYLPSAPAGPSGHPLVIWFHGGGLLQGSKENLPPHFRRLPEFAFGETKEHVAVISPNYRLSPQVPILDIFADVTALLDFVKGKLNDRLDKDGEEDHKIDTGRICLSGGSAGGYLALIAGLHTCPRASDEQVGGFRGVDGIKCIAPFYPITDLEDAFWATKTNPVPWWGKTVTDAAARPHLDPKAPPVFYTVPNGPRSILYPYMLQHGLFPSLLFMRQRAVGQGLDAFRPTPETLSITHRLQESNEARVAQPPLYFVWAELDDKVQPMTKTLEVLKGYNGSVEIEEVKGADHMFDEASGEECEAFREWLGRTLL